MIRFKVTTQGKRSCYASGCFSRIYASGETVCAEPGSVGILVFDTEEHAQDFMDSHCGKYIIIKVKVIGRGKRPNALCQFQNEPDLKNWAHEDHYFDMIPPIGTMAYPAVKVLE